MVSSNYVNDCNILKNYQFLESSEKLEEQILKPYNRKNNNRLLAVDRNKNQLCEINSADIKVLNLFLRLFNKGVLKDKDIKLKAICKHLSQYNWQDLKAANKTKDSDEYKVFANVSELAYKNYLYRKDTSLLAKVADEAQFPESYYKHYENEHITARHYRKMWVDDTLRSMSPRRHIDKFILLKTKDGTQELLKSNERIYEARNNGYKLEKDCRTYIIL